MRRPEAAPAPPAHPAAQPSKRYTLWDRLGRGAHSVVYHGVREYDGQEVAVKIVDLAHAPRVAQGRFAREVNAHRTMNGHPGVIGYHENFVRAGDRAYLVMDYAPGGDLIGVINREHLSGIGYGDDAAAALRPIADALRACHERRIVHRDVKCDNILLAGRRWGAPLKLTDFGLCARFEEDKLLTLPCGSPDYVAPEIARGVAYVGPPVDVWSFGCVVFGTVVGELPFQNLGDERRIVRQLQCQDDRALPPIPEWLSPDCHNLLESIFRYNPDDRPSMAEVLEHDWFEDHDRGRYAPARHPIDDGGEPI